VQVDPIKPKFPPGTKRLKLKLDILLSTSAFKFNLRRYALGALAFTGIIVGVGTAWFTPLATGGRAMLSLKDGVRVLGTAGGSLRKHARPTLNLLLLLLCAYVSHAPISVRVLVFCHNAAALLSQFWVREWHQSP
jgi:hypothetical protein